MGFRACEETPAAPGTTHLQAFDRVGLPPYSPDLPGLSGPVLVRHVVTLPLPTGSVLAGAGYDAVQGSQGYGSDPFVVSDGPVDAQVTASIWEPGDDRRVAWLELSFGDADPVRWETVDGLGIVTDGGDGGFWSPTARSAEPSEDAGDLGPAFDAYTAAAFPEGGPSPSCVVRSTDGVEDGIVFGTGIGDGGYPTYAGRDADGNVVALLNDGGMPWASAGVPGTPPPDYVEPDYTEPV